MSWNYLFWTDRSQHICRETMFVSVLLEPEGPRRLVTKHCVFVFYLFFVCPFLDRGRGVGWGGAQNSKTMFCFVTGGHKRIVTELCVLGPEGPHILVAKLLMFDHMAQKQLSRKYVFRTGGLKKHPLTPHHTTSPHYPLHLSHLLQIINPPALYVCMLHELQSVLVFH